MKIDIGARVRTSDGQHVGEVHRVVVDLDDKAVAGIVVLKGRVLSRDVLVPLDFIDDAPDGDDVVLRLNENQLDALPDFAYNEVVAPPPTWTLSGPYPDETVYVAAYQRKRLGRKQVDIVHGMSVWANDGQIGQIREIELESPSGELDAFWVHTRALFGHDIRIPAEWIERTDDAGIYVSGSRADLKARLELQSRSRSADTPATATDAD